MVSQIVEEDAIFCLKRRMRIVHKSAVRQNNHLRKRHALHRGHNLLLPRLPLLLLPQPPLPLRVHTRASAFITTTTTTPEPPGQSNVVSSVLASFCGSNSHPLSSRRPLSQIRSPPSGGVSHAAASQSVTGMSISISHCPRVQCMCIHAYLYPHPHQRLPSKRTRLCLLRGWSYSPVWVPILFLPGAAAATATATATALAALARWCCLDQRRSSSRTEL